MPGTVPGARDITAIKTDTDRATPTSLRGHLLTSASRGSRVFPRTRAQGRREVPGNEDHWEQLSKKPWLELVDEQPSSLASGRDHSEGVF